MFIVVILPKVSQYTTDKIGVSEAPDMKLIYTSDDLYDIAEAYGEDGRSVYIKMRWSFDVLWPLVYTAFLSLWIWKLSANIRMRKLYLIPIVAMSFDFLENIGTTIVFQVYPKTVMLIPSVTPWLSTMKWLVLGLSFILWFILAIMETYKTLRTGLVKQK